MIYILKARFYTDPEDATFEYATSEPIEIARSYDRGVIEALVEALAHTHTANESSTNIYFPSFAVFQYEDEKAVKAKQIPVHALAFKQQLH